MLSKSNLPRFSLRLSPSAGSYATDARWSNIDLDPVPVAARTWGTGSFAAYWVSDMLAPPMWSTISSVMSLGFSAKEVIPITFFGFLICGTVVALTGRIAAEYHVSFPVLSRASFGMWGCVPMILIRSTVAILWTAISVVQAGGFLENMISAIWPRFSTWNHLPASSNLTSASILSICLYWIIQTSVSVLPIERLRYFFIFKTCLVTPAWFALFVWGACVTHGNERLIKGPESVVDRPYSALAALNIIIGLFSSLAVNMPDFARFSRNHKAGLYQALLLPLIGTFAALGPIFVTAAYEKQHGSYEWFLPAVFSAFDSRAAKFFCGFSFMIATLGNQIAAGSWPMSNDVTGIFPRYLNIRRGAILMAIFCLISCPWDIIANASALLSFLSGYSIFMGPMAGIIVCDYYLVAKCKLSIGDMYNPNGIYRYTRGVNWRAYVAFLVPVAPLLPGLAYNISPSVSVDAGVLHLYSFGWLFGITTSMLIYYVLSIYVSPVPARHLEVGVYPPATEEEEKARREANGIFETESGSDTPSLSDDKKVAEMA